MPAKVDPGLSRVATEARTGGAGGKGAVLAYPKRSSGADPEVLAVFQEELARSAATPAFMHAGRPLWARFIRYYQGLARLPRRARRALQRRWRRSLPAIALLCALGQAPALAATLTVEPGIAPDIGPDGSCSLIEAIENGNADARTHADCPRATAPIPSCCPLGAPKR